jgi:hypothetical protein
MERSEPGVACTDRARSIDFIGRSARGIREHTRFATKDPLATSGSIASTVSRRDRG